MATWRKMLYAVMKAHGEDMTCIISCTLRDDELDIEFDRDFGAIEGKSFTVWTENRVYFPYCYDGAEGVASVARDPDGIPTEHIGG